MTSRRSRIDLPFPTVADRTAWLEAIAFADEPIVVQWREGRIGIERPPTNHPDRVVITNEGQPDEMRTVRVTGADKVDALQLLGRGLSMRGFEEEG